MFYSKSDTTFWFGIVIALCVMVGLFAYHKGNQNGRQEYEKELVYAIATDGIYGSAKNVRVNGFLVWHSKIGNTCIAFVGDSGWTGKVEERKEVKK